MTGNISAGCEGGTGEGQADPAVPVGNDQHPGRGAGDVEEKIRVLDSSLAHRRERGREGSVGCDPCQSSTRPVGEGAAEDGWRGLDDSQLFFVDTRDTTSHWDYWIHPGAISYHRLDEQLLGEPNRPEEDNGLVPKLAPVSRCFNCGSTEHLLSSCPNPRNRALIDLSRQLFAFFANDASQNWKRIHEVEEWKRSRLEWSRVYRPGEITGPLLVDALGTRDAEGTPNMPWLENVSLWGYPPGWISCEDPIERVRRRILDEDDSGGGGEEPKDPCLFAVLNGTPEDSEILQLDSSFPSTFSDPPSVPRASQRWAAYPNTYFLSDILPAYTGRVLPPLAEEHRLGGSSPPPPGVQPPPPPDSPPPLPPSLPHDSSFGGEEDMDLSD